MNDDELDAVIAERFKAYGAGVRLPDGFKARFVRSVRRRRAWRRGLAFGLLAVAAVACAAVAFSGVRGAARGADQRAMMADASHGNDAGRLSCWMLIGYLRECCVRIKPARRRDEEWQKTEK